MHFLERIYGAFNTNTTAKKQIQEAQSLNHRKKWWIYGSMKRKNIFDYCVSPACELAEHRFLAFLLFIEQNNLACPTQKKVLVSYNRQREARTEVLTKDQSLMKGIVPRGYSFGTKISLVLKGELAGTIAFKTQDSVSTNRVKAYRPLIGRSLAGAIQKDIALTDSSIMIFLLHQTHELINQQGYLPALLSLLEDLKIDSDAARIEENSTLLLP